WWFTEPGLLNQLSLSVMFVCSVSTVLFNGNPLLRYDGYYILSDIVEIPNLRQKSSSILNHKLGNWCLGLEEPDDPFLPQTNQAFFALYSVAAVMYRWLVVIMILLFLSKVFEPIGLQVIGRLIMFGALYGLIVQPMWKLYKYFSIPGRLHQVKKARLFATVAIVAGIIAAVCLIPLPHRVYCPLEVLPHNAQKVYIEVPGRLDEPPRPAGTYVKKGDELARLSNLDLELRTVELQSELEVLDEEIKTLHRSRLHEDRLPKTERNAANLLRSKENERRSVIERLEKTREDLQRLRIVAPVDGTVLPGPPASGRPRAPGMLSTWFGTPLDEDNQGAYLQAAADHVLCQIGDPKSMEAVLVIDQSDRNFITEGQSVEILLSHLPHKTFKSTIESIATAEMNVSPRRLSDKAGGNLLTETDASGNEVPLHTSYKATALLPNDDGELSIGLRGQAKIHTRKQTVARRIWRFLNQTFNFDL
ncbi:MAG TPA: hemolysin D, partial [Pirellulales bacterium]|nr:hemolysin D [Pirellulales bacterium]